jgi:hypothetical protein
MFHIYMIYIHNVYDSERATNRTAGVRFLERARDFSLAHSVQADWGLLPNGYRELFFLGEAARS